MTTLHAWHVVRPGPIESALRRAKVAVPDPGAGEVLMKVVACGMCRTDLHIVMGDLPTHRSPVVPVDLWNDQIDDAAVLVHT